MTTKLAGIALVVGIVLSVSSSLFFPGNTFINPVDQTDFPEAVRVIGETPTLAHVTIFLSIVAMMLISVGAFGLFPIAVRQGGISGALLQFGIILSIIEWSIIIIGLGMRHFVTHLMQRATNAGDASFADAALLIHTNLIGVLLGFIVIFPFASMLVGIGVASLIKSMNAFKIAAYLLILSGALGLITYLIAMFAPGDEPIIYLTIFNVLLYIGSIGLFVVGIGMYQGREGLSEEGIES